MLLLGRFVAFVFLLLVNTNGQHCPCKDAPIERDNHAFQRNLNISTDSLILCIADANGNQRRILQKLDLMGITLSFLNKRSDVTAGCNVLLKIINKEDKVTFPTSDRQLCPGVCRPVPEMRIMGRILFGGNLDLTGDLLLTCTLTGSMVPHTVSTTSSITSKQMSSRDTSMNKTMSKGRADLQLGAILRGMFWRRIMECYEKKFWQSRYDREELKPFRDQATAPLSVGPVRNEISRRPVYSLIVWIGSKSKLSLTEEQSKVLSGQPFGGSNGVLGWSATDETFSCRLGKVKCLQRKGRKYLPESAINLMSEGWGCAQRRPLRALAHTLLLVDPELVIVLDDDSYLNYNLLQSMHGESLIRGPLSVRALLMGELIGNIGDEGHLSKWGTFAGGAGYVINKKAIQALTGYEVKYYEGETQDSYVDISNADAIRSNRHIFYLSLYKLGKVNSEKYCSVDKDEGRVCMIPGIPQPSRTLSSTTSLKFSNQSKSTSTSTTRTPIATESESASLAVSISVRLIDFCTNMLANENTCDHRYVCWYVRLLNLFCDQILILFLFFSIFIL